jgi:malonyl-CoA/methylmalonyl-CoA synthetase
MSEGNLYTRLAARFTPDAPFIRASGAHDATYGALHARSAQWARALCALGVVPGDRVAAQIDKSLDGIALYLGTLRAGAAFLPLNTAYTPAEMEYFVGDAAPRVLVCSPDKAAALAPVIATHPGTRLQTLGADGRSGDLLPLVNAQAGQFADAPRNGDDLAAILYTSGTTGRSKGAMLTHDNLWSNAEVLRAAWRYDAKDVLLHALPIFHIHGLFVAINLTLAAGASLQLLPRFDADAVFAALPACNVMMGVPTFYVRLLQDARLTQAATRHVRLFVSGSAPLLADTHREWRERTGHALLERYGMTETGMNASNPYEGDRVAGTVGPPLPGVQIRIADAATGAPLAAGEVGMIEVRGPNVFAGYWRNPEKTRAEFRPDGFFITGDLGHFDERGYLHIVGRGKDLVISGGYNVYPKEVEEEIDALPGVVESAVVGLPHRDFGEGVTAVVVARPDAAELTEAAVLARLRTRLAAYKCPKRVLFVADLPRNTMGKVQKNLLRDHYQNLYLDQEHHPS